MCPCLYEFVQWKFKKKISIFSETIVVTKLFFLQKIISIYTANDRVSAHASIKHTGPFKRPVKIGWLLEQKKKRTFVINFGRNFERNFEVFVNKLVIWYFLFFLFFYLFNKCPGPINRPFRTSATQKLLFLKKRKGHLFSHSWRVFT